jgi:hypothetical protein
MHQPQVPLIEMYPRFVPRRLAEVELGRLVVVGTPTDGLSRAGLALRVDALSAKGDPTEGVLRLGAGPVRFERHALDELVVAIDVEYVLQADLDSIATRHLQSGDLVLATQRPATTLFVATPWREDDGLLDIASAIIRPLADSERRARHVALSWTLVEFENRQRVFYRHDPLEEEFARAPRRIVSEDCD